jgi:glycosyltransferase involved in cell wall biosynthesis
MSKQRPFVSVCTPTFNRRPFIEMMFRCFRNQTYPKKQMEWIIVDDGTDKIQDLVEKSGIEQIKYINVQEKMVLGAKRNLMHKNAKGDILVYMDDDDYYPPERVEHAVETLLSNPQALCAGSSEIYIYFKHIHQMFQSGPFGPTHATAGTFAFRKELLNYTQYDDKAALAEERAFLKEYTIPFVQLNPMKTILVFSHHHNTFDKKNMLDSKHPEYFKESPRKVQDFIKNKHEDEILKFFLQDIDHLLDNYKPGLPKNKPDVLKQMKEIDEQRKNLENRHSNGFRIMIETPGKEKRSMTPDEIVFTLSKQQDEIKRLMNRVQELEGLLVESQKIISVLR